MNTTQNKQQQRFRRGLIVMEMGGNYYKFPIYGNVKVNRKNLSAY